MMFQSFSTTLKRRNDNVWLFLKTIMIKMMRKWNQMHFFWWTYMCKYGSWQRRIEWYWCYFCNEFKNDWMTVNMNLARNGSLIDWKIKRWQTFTANWSILWYSNIERYMIITSCIDWLSWKCWCAMSVDPPPQWHAGFQHINTSRKCWKFRTGESSNSFSWSMTNNMTKCWQGKRQHVGRFFWK